MRPEEIEKELQGIDAKVYVDFEEVETDPLIIQDGASEVVVISVPEPPVAIAIGVGMIAAIATVAIVDTTIKQMRYQMREAARMAEKFSQIDFPSPAASIRGSKNSFRANGRVPLVFGEHLLIPDLAGRPYSSYESGSVFRLNTHDQFFHQIFCLGYSDVHYSDPKIGDNPISNYRDASLSPSTTVFYNRLISEMVVGVRLKHNKPITKTTPEHTTVISVGITFPSGLRTYDDNANAQSFTVSFSIEYRLAGGSWIANTKTITENRDYVRQMYSFTVASGTYEVRVKRTTADSSSGKTMDSAYWDVLQSALTIDDSTAPIYTTKCKIASMKIKATDQISGIVDDFNVIAKLHCRDYLGTGTGASRWRKRATRNPASALLYLLTHPHVNKKPVPNSSIQWGEFEEFHKWCKQKGFTFDAVISGDYTIGDIAAMICTAGRAKLTRFNGTYGVQIERPSTAIDFALTPRNTKGGMVMSKIFNEQTKNLAVKFIDRTNGYVEVTRVCSIDDNGTIHYDRAENQRTGETTEITLVGVTDPDHAMKLAAFELARLSRRTIQYTVPQDWEQMTAFPGAVGYLANDMFLYGLGSGKVTARYGSAGAWTGVDLDTGMTMESGKSYSLMIRMNDPAHGIKIHPLITIPSDRFTWNAHNSGVTARLRAITYGAGKFVAAGNSGVILTSPDGVTWTKRASGVTDRLRAATYAAGVFVVTGSNGVILTSPDGVTWTKRASGVTDRLYSVAYGGGVFVVTGYANTILTSPDGVTWTKRASGVMERIYSVAYGGGKFVAATGFGTIVTSPDGVTWTARTSGVIGRLYIAYGGGKFVAATGLGEILTSPDGVTWTKRASWPGQHLYAATYAAGVFVVTGFNGGIVTSPDGVTWTREILRTRPALFSVTYGAGKFVAVAYSGGIHVKFYPSNTLRFASPVTQGIEPGNLCIFGEAGKEGIRVLCESISQGGSDDGTLSLVEYAEEIYQADSGSIPAWDPKITIPRSSSHEPAYPVIEMVSDLGRKEARTAASTPTYQELADGYNFQGGTTTPKGTTTPTDVTLEAEGVFRGVVLRWDRQVNLTNFARYEVQVSDDSGTTWYSLQLDGTGYRNALNQWTAWPSETLVHAGISPTGTDAAPTGRTLKYRVRRVTRANVASSAAAASAQAEATTSLVETGDVAANAITANKIDTAALNAMIARIRDTVSIGEHGFTSVNNKRAIVGPQDKDRRMYLDRDEVHLEQYDHRHLYIAIGYSGIILTSTDLITWTKRDIGVTTHLNTTHLNEVTYGAGRFVVIGWGNILVTSTDGINWTPGRLLHGQGMERVSYLQGKFWGVGNGNSVITSTDGLNWTRQDLDPGNTRACSNIAYGAGVFVVTGHAGRIFTSPDGTTWTKRTSGVTGWLPGLVYGNGIFVATGNSGAILTSPDGINWTTRTSGVSGRLWGVTYAAGQFVAVGVPGEIVTSPDGVTWTKRVSGTTESLVAVKYGEGHFVAVGFVGTILTSPDGITWTSRTSAVTSTLFGVMHHQFSREWDSVIRLGGEQNLLKFYGRNPFAIGINPAWGHAHIDGYVYHSGTNRFGGPLGIEEGSFSVSRGDWVFRVDPVEAEGTGALQMSIMKGGGLQMKTEIKNGIMNLVLAGALIAHGGCKVPAGGEWDTQTSVTSNHLYAIAYGAGQFMAVGFSGEIVTSPDGITWTRRTSGTTVSLSGITYGAGKFVVVGLRGTILTSPDGITWTRRTSGTGQHLRAATYAAGVFVVTVLNGEILTSPDGVTWTARTSGAAEPLYGMVYGSGQFVVVGGVVVGGGGEILTSPDGVTWTARTSGTMKTLYAVTYAAGQFVAVGFSGEIVTSPDGITWTSRTSGTTVSLYGITYGAGQFVAAGTSGVILTSPDGITWTRRTSGTGAILRGIAYGAGKFVAGGDNGVILTGNGTTLDIWEQRNKP